MMLRLLLVSLLCGYLALHGASSSRNAFAFAAAGALAFLLRDRIAWMVAPMSTLIHEIGHALAAKLSQGDCNMISVSSEGGGLASTKGGSRVLILAAGYLTPILLGVFLICATRPLTVRVFTAVVATVLAVSVLWSSETFTRFLSVTAATAFGYLAMTEHAVLRRVVLPVFGWLLILQGIRSLLYVWRNHIPNSDTARLGRRLGVSGKLVAFLMLAVCSLVIVGALVISS